jgi:3-dehydroquinate synthase class II
MINKEILEDNISYSDMVNVVDKNLDNGKEFLILIAEKLEERKKVIKKLERQLNNEKLLVENLNWTVINISNHLSLSQPYAFKIDDGVVNVKNDTVFIDKNFI